MSASTRSARRRFRVISRTAVRPLAPRDFDDSVSQRVLDLVRARTREQVIAEARAAADEYFDRVLCK